MFWNKKKYLYTDKEIDKIENHICESFGLFDAVYHEMRSDDMHIDVALIRPTEEYNFYTLVTMGMGAYDMKMSKTPNIELMMCLPPDWNVTSTADNDYWPITTLQWLARMPKDKNFNLGLYHTVDKQDNFPNTGFCGVLLEYPRNFKFENMTLDMGKKKITFLQVYPVYREELDELVRDNADIYDKIPENTILDIHRQNYAKNL